MLDDAAEQEPFDSLVEDATEQEIVDLEDAVGQEPLGC